MVSHSADVAARHPDIKDMAKGTAFRIRLSKVDTVAAVELIVDAGRGTVWTLRDGQHNGFPGLKTTTGLLLIDAEARNAHQQAWEAAKTPAQRRAELLRLFDSFVVDPCQIAAWPNAGHRRRIAERLNVLRQLADNPQSAAVPAAFERFLAALASSPSFLEGFVACFAAAVRDRGDEWLEPVRTALLGPATLAIDVDESDFERDAGDARQIGPVSAALGGGTQGGESGVACALSGTIGHLHRGNFPQPNLPGLGQTYLFARNKDIPSLTRYGRTADASFPIDSDLVRRLSGVITSLTEPDAKGRSWRLIPAETGDKPDLLVTSLRSLRAADAIAGEDEDEDAVDGHTAWNELSAQLIRQTRGEETGGAPLDDVVILILRTVDPANRKTIYRRTLMAEEIWQAARRWQEATANVPDWLGFTLPVRGKKKAKFRKAPFVRPLSITPLSRILFANGGRRRVPVIGVTASDAFGLFLRDGEPKKRAMRLLPLLLERHGPLLSGVAAAKIRGNDNLKKFDPKTDLRRDALRSTTWIGTLLYDIGRFSSGRADMPEDTVYTKSLAFRLGQLLSAADYLHKGYCADLRGGDLPPALIGNSVLAVAGSDPTRALAILSSRLKPYLAWADRGALVYKKATEEEKRDMRRAIALRQGLSQARQAKSSALALSTLLSPYRNKERTVDDAFKAELLLGYMAGFPPLPKKDGEASIESTGAIEGGEIDTQEEDQE